MSQPNSNRNGTKVHSKGQKQPREVGAEAPTLRHLCKEVVEVDGVLLERTGRGRTVDATGHDITSSLGLPCPASFNKVPTNLAF